MKKPGWDIFIKAEAEQIFIGKVFSVVIAHKSVRIKASARMQCNFNIV